MTHVELQHITIGYGHRVLLEDVSAAIGGGRHGKKYAAACGRGARGAAVGRDTALRTPAECDAGARARAGREFRHHREGAHRQPRQPRRGRVGAGSLYRLAGASAARRPCGRRPCLESGGDGRFRRQADGSPVGRRGAARDDRACACAGHAGDLARRADGFSRHAQSLRVVYAAASAGA